MTRLARAFRRVERFVPALVILGVLAIWEIAARLEIISHLFFPEPTRILANLWQMTWDGRLLPNVAATVIRLLVALVAGAIPGITLGLAMGWFPRLRRLVDPIVAAVHPIPKISVFPMIIMIFGIGEFSKTMAVAISVFFPCLINSMAGVRQLPEAYFEVARNYGANRWKTFQRVVWPGSLPMVLAGLRIALAVALVVTIAIELLLAGEGLGVIIWYSWQTLRTEDLYSTLIVIALIGYLSNVSVRKLGDLLAPWNSPENGGLYSA